MKLLIGAFVPAISLSILPVLTVLLERQSFAQSIEYFGEGTDQFSISFSLVGDPGNLAAEIGNPPDSGSVPYSYRIAKFAVSRDQIEKANSLGGLAITLDPMSFVGGILGSGPRPQMPATGMSWNQAARFVNWLNSSQGYPPAYRFAAQPGQGNYNSNANLLLWSVEESFVDGRGVNRFRHKDCRYFLPSLDEWFKAAHYDSSTSTYLNYPTGDNQPNAVASGVSANTAVYDQSTEQGPADITQSGGLSSYGAMGMGGNIWELEESTFSFAGGYNNLATASRGGRGGSWNSGFNSLAVNGRLNTVPNLGSNRTGFRVASVAGDFSASAMVVGSFVYYGDSIFSEQGVESALDSSKSLAREGSPQTLGFENLINTTKGINGLVFDIDGLGDSGALSAEDFVFQVSPQGTFDLASNPPAGWVAAPTPISVTVYPGATSRVLIQWSSESIMDRWMRITLLATASTGLSEPDTYYLGHLLGEVTGVETDGTFRVQFSDVSSVRDQIGQNAGVDDVKDIDKNGSLNFSDLNFVRQNIGASLSSISIP